MKFDIEFWKFNINFNFNTKFESTFQAKHPIQIKTVCLEKKNKTVVT